MKLRIADRAGPGGHRARPDPHSLEQERPILITELQAKPESRRAPDTGDALSGRERAKSGARWGRLEVSSKPFRRASQVCA